MIPSIGTTVTAAADLAGRRDAEPRDPPPVHRDQVGVAGPDGRGPSAPESDPSARHDARGRERQDRDADRGREPDRVLAARTRREGAAALDEETAASTAPGERVSSAPDARVDDLRRDAARDVDRDVDAERGASNPPATLPRVEAGPANPESGSDPTGFDAEPREWDAAQTVARMQEARVSGADQDRADAEVLDDTRAAQVLRELQAERDARREDSEDDARARQEDEADARAERRERLAEAARRATRTGAFELADVTRRSVFDRTI